MVRVSNWREIESSRPVWSVLDGRVDQEPEDERDRKDERERSSRRWRWSRLGVELARSHPPGTMPVAAATSERDDAAAHAHPGLAHLGPPIVLRPRPRRWPSGLAAGA